MTFREEIILLVNRKNIGDVFEDKTDRWDYRSNRPFINSLIKLGYVERLEWDKLKKLKDIPEDLSYQKARELTKDIKLPKKQHSSTWGKLVNTINNSTTDKIYIKPERVSSKRTWSYYKSVNTYLMWLKNLEYIKIIKKDRSFGFKIERLKQIPDGLTVTKAQKFLYDQMYKRSIKIDKIKEQMNNI
jgi:hypothetical protein